MRQKRLNLVVLLAIATFALLLSAMNATAQLVGDDEVTPEPYIGRPEIIGQPALTTYEELLNCGLYAQETRLACTMQIKQINGYNGPINSFGSFEHVLFCVDWNGNGAYTNAEVVGEVTTHVYDETAGANPPWYYVVYRDFVPPGGPRTSNAGVAGATTTQSIGRTFKARAILSWDTAPTTCNFVPVWGNQIDFIIRLDPIR